MDNATEANSDGGWTQVGRGKNHKKASRKESHLTPSLTAPPPADRDMTVAKLHQEYQARMKVWRASTCRKDLFRILDRVRPDEGWQIERAVCLASGSFSRDNLENRRRSGFQFAVFMDIVERLRQDGDGNTMEVVAQEPWYTPVDVEFLKSLEVEVCTVPGRSQDMKDDSNTTDDYWRVLGTGPGSKTFVCDLFMELNEAYLQRLLNLEVGFLISAVMINVHLLKQIYRASENRTPPYMDSNCHGLTLADIFQRHYQSYYFPDFSEDPNIFGGLSVISREPVESDDEDG